MGQNSSFLAARHGEFDGVISFLGVRQDPCIGLGMGLRGGWRGGGGLNDNIGDRGRLMVLLSSDLQSNGQNQSG